MADSNSAPRTSKLCDDLEELTQTDLNDKEKIAKAVGSIKVCIEELYQQKENLTASLNALQNDCKHYRELFDPAPEAYLLTDPEGIIWRANPASFEMLKSDILGKSISHLLFEGDGWSLQEQLRRIRPGEILNWLMLRPGTQISGSYDPQTYSASVSARYNHGQITGYVWQLRDMSRCRMGYESLPGPNLRLDRKNAWR